MIGYRRATQLEEWSSGDRSRCGGGLLTYPGAAACHHGHRQRREAAGAFRRWRRGTLSPMTRTDRPPASSARAWINVDGAFRNRCRGADCGALLSPPAPEGGGAQARRRAVVANGTMGWKRAGKGRWHGRMRTPLPPRVRPEDPPLQAADRRNAGPCRIREYALSPSSSTRRLSRRRSLPEAISAGRSWGVMSVGSPTGARLQCRAARAFDAPDEKLPAREQILWDVGRKKTRCVIETPPGARCTARLRRAEDDLPAGPPRCWDRETATAHSALGAGTGGGNTAVGREPDGTSRAATASHRGSRRGQLEVADRDRSPDDCGND